MVKHNNIITTLIIFFICGSFNTGEAVTNITVHETIQKLQAMYPETQHLRIGICVPQAAELWRDEDGNDEEFQEFCMKQFMGDQDSLDELFQRFETNLETLHGHFHEVNRVLSTPLALDLGHLLPVDYLFAEYSPFVHVMDDFFDTKLAFAALLNFPHSSLEDMIREGHTWSRRKWAEARFVQGYIRRIPAEISRARSKAYLKAGNYISDYNIYMHQVMDENGNRPFPEGLRLISHWGLRDELKAQYASPGGVKNQRIIQTIMERIIMQEIPADVIDKPGIDWKPFSNTVYKESQKIHFEREPDTRYRMLLETFHSEQKTDPYFTGYQTKMDRRFKLHRMVPEEQFENLIISVLTDPVTRNVARLISKRLKRKLEPFDIWYNGFKPRSQYDETFLDEYVREKYPDVAAFQNGLVTILRNLGFNDDVAGYLAQNVVVDPSRGVGHAMGAGKKGDKAHLRTRFTQNGMNYKGYNIAVHELGHNIEQIFSLNSMDYYSLRGVPNTAFSEAFAFVFQSRDLALLGISDNDPMAEHLKTLDILWATCEIGAVGLVDTKVWHWMYDHPDATTEDLKHAVIEISKEVWNKYYKPVLGMKDEILLGIYSHMISGGLYLPDYSIGHIIMFQIEQYLKDKNLGNEMERMCSIGSVSPDEWMRQAVGSTISADPLISAAKRAVEALK